MNGDGYKALDPAIPAHSVQLFPTGDEAAAATDFGQLDTILQFATIADDLPAWGSQVRLRDQKLREFLTTEPWLLSAIYAMCARNSAFGWRLNGPARTVEASMRLLQEADFGRGWHHYVEKVTLDLLTQDNGAFTEVIRSGPRAQDPVLGIAHLDAGRCTRTADPDYPVLYEDRKGRRHRLGWWQVIPMVELPAAIERLNGIGYCAVTRVLRAAQSIREVEQYRFEKTSGRFNRRIILVTGPDKRMIDAALADQKSYSEEKGWKHFTAPVILSSLDPSKEAKVAEINLASLPEGFSDDERLRWYIALLALALGADYQDLAPLPGGNLGTSTQSEVLARKSSGKGPALFQKILGHLVNWEGILPRTVEFVFDEDDLAEDEAKATVGKLRAEERQIRILGGELSIDEARHLAVESGDLPSEMLEAPDHAPMAPPATVSPETVRDDEESPGTEQGTTGTDEEKAIGEEAQVSRWLAYVAKAETREQEGARILRGLFADQEEAILERVAADAKAAAREPFPRARWKKRFERLLSPWLAEAMRDGWDNGRADLDLKAAPPQPELGAVVEIGIDWSLENPLVREWLAARVTWSIEAITDTTFDAVRAVLDPGIAAGESIPELSARVRSVMTDASQARATMIARTEAITAANRGALALAKQSGVATGKQWWTALDERVEEVCRALHGVTVPLDGTFPGGLECPAAHPRCRCRLTWIVGGLTLDRRDVLE